jgi:hypothetical protein
MSIKEKIGNIAGISLGIALVILFVILGIGLWWGGIAILMSICNAIVPHIATINSWVTTFCIFIFLPLLAIKKARVISCYGFGLAAMTYGLLLFAGSTAIVYSFWGSTGVSVGIFLGGITMIPMALLALLVNGKFGVLGMTLLQCALVGGAVFASSWAGSKASKYR